MPLPPLLRTKNYIDARFDQPPPFAKLSNGSNAANLYSAFSDCPTTARKTSSAAPSISNSCVPASPNPLPSSCMASPARASPLSRCASPGRRRRTSTPSSSTCGQRPLDAITAELADRLPIDVKTRPPEEQRAAAKAWLRQRQSLLVLDDVWSKDVRSSRPARPARSLYTSRVQSLPWVTPAETVKLEKFTDAEAEELFHTYLDAVFGKEEVARQREALLAFARQVELLPIAVAVGANMLRQKAASALNRAVLRIPLNALTDGAKDVNALFRTAIESRTETEQKLLTACAICVQEGFWLPLAAEIAGLTEDEAEDAADVGPSSLLRITRILEDDRERRRFSLHALLRDQLRARLSRDDLAILQGCTLRCWRGYLPIARCDGRTAARVWRRSFRQWGFCRSLARDSRAGELSFRGYDIAEDWRA